jgi:hypothetical protein
MPNLPLDRADVIAAYRLILGREPESEAVIEDQLARHDSLEALRATLLASAEFRPIARACLPDPPTGGVVTEAEVAAIYRALLGREPESAEVGSRQRAAGRTPIELVQEIAASEEFAIRMREEAAIAALRRHPPPRRGGPPPPAAAGKAAAPPKPLRLLLFGAYGNGNLGDAAQAEALARLLGAYCTGPVQCAATSWLDHEAYDARPARRRAPDALLDGEKLAGFDAVVIGGGGMLDPPHFPLHRPEWIRAMLRAGIPYGFAGMGASRGVTRARALRSSIEALLRGAAFVAVRDSWSVAAVEGLCEGWFDLPDPVLAAWLLLGRPPPAPGAPAAPPSPVDTLMIVKAPAPGHAAEEAFLAAAAEAARAAPEGAVRAVVVEPRKDERALAGLFPGGVVAVRDFAALVAHCAAARRVVSMRYHGAIAGVLAGVPTLGGTAGKVRTFLAALGCPANALPEAAGLAARLAPDAPLPATVAPEVLEGLRRLADAGMRRIARALDAATGRAAVGAAPEA